MSETIPQGGPELEVRTLSNSVEVLTCCLRGEVVGWSALCPLDPAAAYELTRQLSVFVDREHRRQGVGGWLVAEAVGFAERAGVKALVAFPPLEPEWARHWLLAQGFEEMGRVPRATPLAAGWADAAVLQLLLGVSEE